VTLALLGDRFIADTPFRVHELPFFAEKPYEKGPEPDDGRDPVGHFIFVDQLHPMGCCCYTTPVRYSIRMSPSEAEPSLSQITLLSLYTEVAKGIPTTNPCAWCCVRANTVPVPWGNHYADQGMLAVTQWLTPREMQARTKKYNEDNSNPTTHVSTFKDWGAEEDTADQGAALKGAIAREVAKALAAHGVDSSKPSDSSSPTEVEHEEVQKWLCEYCEKEFHELKECERHEQSCKYA
jgi:hypothetical protein